MSTAPLVSTWKSAEIIGVDLSKEMLEKAREILPIVTFIQRDCSKPLFDMGAFDLIFSNDFAMRDTMKEYVELAAQTAEEQKEYFTGPLGK